VDPVERVSHYVTIPGLCPRPPIQVAGLVGGVWRLDGVGKGGPACGRLERDYWPPFSIQPDPDLQVRTQKLLLSFRKVRPALFHCSLSLSTAGRNLPEGDRQPFWIQHSHGPHWQLQGKGLGPCVGSRGWREGVSTDPG
jgi:hypothetical protein